ncbi:MAG TPA: hypothetical protein VGB30_07250 [bacterium]
MDNFKSWVCAGRYSDEGYTFNENVTAYGNTFYGNPEDLYIAEDQPFCLNDDFYEVNEFLDH